MLTLTAALATPLPFASVTWITNWIRYWAALGSSMLLPVPIEMNSSLRATVSCTESVIGTPASVTVPVTVTPFCALVEEPAR